MDDLPMASLPQSLPSTNNGPTVDGHHCEPPYIPVPALPPLPNTCTSLPIIGCSTPDSGVDLQQQNGGTELTPEMTELHHSDVLSKQPLYAATPDQVMTPPNTPVTSVCNPCYLFNPDGTIQTLTNVSPTMNAFQSVPSIYPQGTTLTLPAGISSYPAQGNIGKLTPLMHLTPVTGAGDLGVGGGGGGGGVGSAGSMYTRVPCCQYASNGVPVYTPPLSPFTARAFPLIPAAPGSLIGPGNSYYAPSGDAQLVPVGTSLVPAGVFQAGTHGGALGIPGYGPGAGAGFAGPVIPSTNNNPGRPPYSFSALIAMAIQSSPTKMRTLPDIYDYIAEKFPFYQRADKKWKNSVRHNLSLNQCFKKAPRKDGERMKGKGNYWIIDPNSDHVLDNGSFRSPSKRKRRKGSCSSSVSPAEMPDVGVGCERLHHYSVEGAGSEPGPVVVPTTPTAEVFDRPPCPRAVGSDEERISDEEAENYKVLCQEQFQQAHHLSDFGVDKLIAK